MPLFSPSRLSQAVGGKIDWLQRKLLRRGLFNAQPTPLRERFSMTNVTRLWQKSILGPMLRQDRQSDSELITISPGMQILQPSSQENFLLVASRLVGRKNIQYVRKQDLLLYLGSYRQEA
jgi:hypothetical protein